MTREADQYQNATLVNGLPTCIFAPKPYARSITNIVVENGATSAVMVYRGSLTSVPAARNDKGSSNTLQGRIALPAGQILYIQWSAPGDPVSSATARVSFERQDGPFQR